MKGWLDDEVSNVSRSGEIFVGKVEIGLYSSFLSKTIKPLVEL